MHTRQGSATHAGAHRPSIGARAHRQPAFRTSRSRAAAGSRQESRASSSSRPLTPLAPSRARRGGVALAREPTISGHASSGTAGGSKRPRSAGHSKAGAEQRKRRKEEEGRSSRSGSSTMGKDYYQVLGVRYVRNQGSPPPLPPHGTLARVHFYHSPEKQGPSRLVAFDPLSIIDPDHHPRRRTLIPPPFNPSPTAAGRTRTRSRRHTVSWRCGGTRTKTSTTRSRPRRSSKRFRRPSRC